MALFRPLFVFSNRFSISKFARENGNVFSPSKHTFFTPLMKTNLPSLVCVCEKKTIAEELGIPEPPKKPVPGFFHFLKEKSGAYPDLSTAPERIKLLKQDWTQLMDSEKSKYNDYYATKLKEYQKKNKVYLDSLSDEQKENMKLLRSSRIQEKRAKRARRERQKALKEAGKPEHPGGVFSVFCRKSVGKQLTIKDLHENWRQLPETKKEAYHQERREMYMEYKEKLILWEQRMKESGQEYLLEKLPSRK